MNGRSHDCPGDDCPRCEPLIAHAENPDPAGPTDWQTAQDDYERYLDRLGE